MCPHILKIWSIFTYLVLTLLSVAEVPDLTFCLLGFVSASVLFSPKLFLMMLIFCICFLDAALFF